jgi:hypothetical protein
VTFGAFQGQLRPLVEAAWRNHAGLLGLSTADAAERDEFYRAHLWAACRIQSSKAADERQRVALLVYFRDLTAAEPPAAPQPNVVRPEGLRTAGLSYAQEDAFWGLAVKAHSIAVGRDPDLACTPFADWLAARLQEAGGHVAGGVCYVGIEPRTRGFDRVMGALAVIAGDRYWLSRTAEGSERRLHWQINRFMDDLSWLEGQPVRWSYVAGIHKQAHHGLPESIDECTVRQLVDVLDALDTHIRRLCGRFSIRPCHLPTRPPASPDLLAEWRWYHHPTPGHTRAPNGQLLAEKGAA